MVTTSSPAQHFSVLPSVLLLPAHDHSSQLSRLENDLLRLPAICLAIFACLTLHYEAQSWQLLLNIATL